MKNEIDLDGTPHIPGQQKTTADENMIMETMLVSQEGSKRPKELGTLVEQTKSARAALLEALAGLGAAIDLFKPKSSEYISELRQFRMSAVAELAITTKSFEDVRKFFLSNDHQSEIQRLKEFVELCERLNSLKQSGFLDKISDTILKLS